MYFANIAIVLTGQTARFIGTLFLFNEIFKLRDRVNNFFLTPVARISWYTIIFCYLVTMVAHCSFCKATSLIDKGYATEKRKTIAFYTIGNNEWLHWLFYENLSTQSSRPLAPKWGESSAPSSTLFSWQSEETCQTPHKTRKPLCLALVWTHWDKLNNHRSLSESCAWLRLSLICY